jgi:SAM-dependent methyltransferase
MSQPLSNSYSSQWFDFFQVGIPNGRTDKETEFVSAVAPLPEFRRVLDICCGMGRHARALAARGYAVIGVERDAVAIATARRHGGAVEYFQADVRDYRPPTEGCDLIISMSQSFGYFDDATNCELLSRWADSLRKGGQMILDLWNPAFFATHQGERELQTATGIVRERTQVQTGWLFVHLTYPDGADDNFDWQLFSPAQMNRVADGTGLRLLAMYSDYQVGASSSANPKIQFVLEKQ